MAESKRQRKVRRGPQPHEWRINGDVVCDCLTLLGLAQLARQRRLICLALRRLVLWLQWLHQVRRQTELATVCVTQSQTVDQTSLEVLVHHYCHRPLTSWLVDCPTWLSKTRQSPKER